jgi:hypothetical protein
MRKAFFLASGLALSHPQMLVFVIASLMRHVEISCPAFGQRAGERVPSDQGCLGKDSGMQAGPSASASDSQSFLQLYDFIDGLRIRGDRCLRAAFLQRGPPFHLRKMR